MQQHRPLSSATDNTFNHAPITEYKMLAAASKSPKTPADQQFLLLLLCFGAITSFSSLFVCLFLFAADHTNCIPLRLPVLCEYSTGLATQQSGSGSCRTEFWRGGGSQGWTPVGADGRVIIHRGRGAAMAKQCRSPAALSMAARVRPSCESATCCSAAFQVSLKGLVCKIGPDVYRVFLCW